MRRRLADLAVLLALLTLGASWDDDEPARDGGATRDGGPTHDGDATHDASTPRPDASIADAGRDAGTRSECVPPEPDRARAAELCVCDDTDGGRSSRMPMVAADEDAGHRIDDPDPWPVSMECMCALGHCAPIEQVVSIGTPTCGCGNIHLVSRDGLGFVARTYDLATLELVGVVKVEDSQSGHCLDFGYAAGEIGVSTCDDHRSCDLPASVRACPPE
jgi:hypothetical protein